MAEGASIGGGMDHIHLLGQIFHQKCILGIPSIVDWGVLPHPRSHIDGLRSLHNNQIDGQSERRQGIMGRGYEVDLLPQFLYQTCMN